MRASRLGECSGGLRWWGLARRPVLAALARMKWRSDLPKPAPPSFRAVPLESMLPPTTGPLQRVTFAVLGCGTDVVYPDRHRELFARIAASGGLLSEYPPGTPPRHRQFPARNRLIAGLAEAVIVVEAAVRSGALITARLARTFGRPLFAVPGSPGTDALLRAGHAFSAASAEGVLHILAGGEVRSSTVERAPGPFAELLTAISLGWNSPDDLCTQLGMALPSILAALAEAELEGFVKRAAGNTYEVIGREY